MLYHKEDELLNLVGRFLAGEEDAFEQVIRLVYADIVNIAFCHIGNEEDAKDVSQQVCLKLYGKLKLFRHCSKLSTWIYRVTVNSCIDFLRRFKRVVPLNEAITKDSDDTACFTQNLENEERQKKIQEKLNGLSLQQKNAVIFKHFEGLTIAQVSRIMRCSQSSVKTHLCRAVEKLRKELGGEDELC